jgi:hypothetical protein
VDKVVFLHNVNGLRASGCAGQALRLACTDLVQMSAACRSQPFCTFVPVDMHGFVHSRCQLARAVCHCQPVASERERFSDLANQSRTWPGRKCGFPPTNAASNEKKIFGRTARSTSGLQPKSVYKDSSSVNNCHFLWISLLTDKKSVVYARYKPVICCCMFLVANLDKNRDRGKSRVFAQTVPVDIKKLIHTCPSGALFTIW